jgi:hypothetical protein
MTDGVRLAIDAFFPHAKDTQSDSPYPFHDYPWLDVTDVSDGGRNIHILIKFWTGGQYCCESAACRFLQAFFNTNWLKLRELLRREGVEPMGPIKFFVRVVHEPGIMFACSPGEPDTDYFEVANGSWCEYETKEDEPTREQRPVRSSKASKEDDTPKPRTGRY